MTARRNANTWAATALLALVLGPALSGCADSDAGPPRVALDTASPAPSSSGPAVSEARVVTDTVAFGVRAPGAAGTSPAVRTSPCARVVLDLGDITIEANATACEPWGGTPGNGRHGLYRTPADIPPGTATETIRTPLGEAVVFTQEYFEATNSVTRWREPVAIVTLTEPGSPTHPTLVLRSDKGVLDQAALSRFASADLLPAR